MARLQPNENPHIDNINRLVKIAKQGTGVEVDAALEELLEIFKPMILGICRKWSNFFNDGDHIIITFNTLLSDARYWFMYYTVFKYVIDGAATYNNFIKNHVDQRIRYIYEREIKYVSGIILPDPYEDQSHGDTFDTIMDKYTTDGFVADPHYGMVETFADNSKHKLINKIYELLSSDTFNDRERDIFNNVINGVTHEQMAEVYGISRTRVTQILAKTKTKLYKKIEADPDIWAMLDDAGIDITNPKLME